MYIQVFIYDECLHGNIIHAATLDKYSIKVCHGAR